MASRKVVAPRRPPKVEEADKQETKTLSSPQNQDVTKSPNVGPRAAIIDDDDDDTPLSTPSGSTQNTPTRPKREFRVNARTDRYGAISNVEADKNQKVVQKKEEDDEEVAPKSKKEKSKETNKKKQLEEDKEESKGKKTTTPSTEKPKSEKQKAISLDSPHEEASSEETTGKDFSWKTFGKQKEQLKSEKKSEETENVSRPSTSSAPWKSKVNPLLKNSEGSSTPKEPPQTAWPSLADPEVRTKQSKQALRDELQHPSAQSPKSDPYSKLGSRAPGRDPEADRVRPKFFNSKLSKDKEITRSAPSQSRAISDDRESEESSVRRPRFLNSKKERRKS